MRSRARCRAPRRSPGPYFLEPLGAPLVSPVQIRRSRQRTGRPGSRSLGSPSGWARSWYIRLKACLESFVGVMEVVVVLDQYFVGLLLVEFVAVGELPEH